MAEEVILLIDSTKLMQRSEYFFAEISQLSQIITDDEADPEIIRQLISKGCSVTVAEQTTT